MLSNLKIAFFAQAISLLVSFVSSLLLPKVLSVEEYGYWQLFIFYTSYIGVLYFGICDGVYLINGGKRRDEIDKPAVKAQFLIGTLIQFVAAASLIIYATSLNIPQERSNALLLTAVMILFANTTGYWGLVFQAINETKLYSISVLINRIVFFVPLVIMLWLGIKAFEAYGIVYAGAQIVSCGVVLFWARDFISARCIGRVGAILLVFESAKVGFSLLVSNFSSMIILGVLRIVCDVVWGIGAFGELSFTLTLANFFLAFVSQVGMVLFPSLRLAGRQNWRKQYNSISFASSIVLPLVCICYFPLIVSVPLWLPQYGPCLRYLIYLLPICVFSSVMSLLGTTFCKVTRQEKALLIINIFSAFLSFVGSITGAMVFASIDSMLFFTLLVMVGRCLASEFLFSNLINSDGLKPLFFLILFSAVFIISVHMMNTLMAFFVCLGAYLYWIWLNKKEARSLILQIRRT